MKPSVLTRAGLGFFAALGLACTNASALVEFGRGVLTLTTRFDASYDSNILGQNQADGDTILTFGPSLEFKREGGRGSLTLNAGADLVRYLQDGSRDHENYTISGGVTAPVAPGSPFSGDANVSYSESTSVNETVNDLVRTNSLILGANGAYAFSERLSLTGGGSWGQTENNNFGDNESINLSAGVSLQKFLFRRLPLTLSYSFSNSQSTNDPTAVDQLDTTSHSFNVGTNGDITPKISGGISVGVRSTEDDGAALNTGGTSSGFVASSSLTWTVDELTSVAFNLSKSLDVSADNQSTDTTSVSLSLSRKLSELLSANAGVSHSWNNFRGALRDDRLLGLNAGLSYQIRKHWSADLNYRFSDNSSDIDASDFTRHLTSLSITAQF